MSTSWRATKAAKLHGQLQSDIQPNIWQPRSGSSPIEEIEEEELVEEMPSNEMGEEDLEEALDIISLLQHQEHPHDLHSHGKSTPTSALKSILKQGTSPARGFKSDTPKSVIIMENGSRPATFISNTLDVLVDRYLLLECGLT
jgi:hypothetical protein